MGTLRLTRDGVELAAIPVARDAGIVVAPGGDLNAAYSQVPTWGTIWLQTGSYGIWNTPAGTKVVTVRAQAGATPKFRQIQCYADNLTFDGLRLDADGTKTAGALFETHGHRNITFKNGFIGNVHNEKGALAGGNEDTLPLNIVFENVSFDNITFDAGVHSEAIYSQAPALTVRNCYFGRQCGATGAIYITRGSWWGQPEYGGWLFEGNTFERQVADHGGIVFGEPSGTSVVDGAVIRGNTFLHASALPTTTSSKTFINSVESCNTPRVDLAGITHEACA